MLLTPQVPMQILQEGRRAGQRKGVLHCVQERAQGHPCVSQPCHQIACCSHLAGLLLGVPSQSPAADRNQRLLQPPAHLGTLWPPGWS